MIRNVKVAGRQRLAALAGILCRSTEGNDSAKVVVFLSSKDSVEFHQQLFQTAFKFVAGRPLVDCPIYKLHGSLMQVIPTAQVPKSTLLSEAFAMITVWSIYLLIAKSNDAWNSCLPELNCQNLAC